MIKRVFSIAIIFTLFIPMLSFAESGWDFLSLEDDTEKKVTLTVGEVNVFKVSRPDRVSIRNPEIADISKVEDDEVVVVARQVGNTVLTIWSGGKKQEYYVVVHPKNLDRAKKELEKLINENLGIRKVRLKKNEVSGKIMVMGEVFPYQKEQVDKVLANFEKGQQGIFIDNLLIIEDESKMVEIEAQIFELTKNLSKSLGVDWPGTAGTSPTPMTTLTAPAKTGTWSDVFRVVDWTRSSFDIKIMAAITEGKGKVLARPKLLCLSGEEADFLVGGEIPVVTVSATAAGETVAEDIEYKEFGVKLNIRPVVLRDGGIKLNLMTEVSDLSSEGQYVRGDGTIIKAFSTRTLSSVLRLEEGQAIIMSGLLKDKVVKDDIHKVPGLADIPLLGALFRSKDYQQDQTELVISLVPRIIDSKKEEIGAIAETRNSQDVSWASKPLIQPSYLRQNPSMERYVLRVKKKIISFLNYPRLAQEAGWHGKLKVKLHLDYAGDLLDAAISESSGYISFDKDVLKLVKSLSPYPPFPSDVKVEDLWMEIPVVFRND